MQCNYKTNARKEKTVPKELSWLEDVLILRKEAQQLGVQLTGKSNKK